jgi:hypothetical protein
MISVLTDYFTGGTFLTWTLYYLSGKTKYFSVKNQSTIAVPHNPLTARNAHKFIVNQPFNTGEFQQFLPLLVDKDEYLYMHPFSTGTREAIDELANYATKTIVLSLSKDQVLYQQRYVPRAEIKKAFLTNQLLVTPDAMYDDFVEHFFKESKTCWQRENLNDIWDKREFIALNFDPFGHDSILTYINHQIPRYHLNCMNLWTTFDQTVKHLCDYLEFAIDHSRYQQWLQIYHQWKVIHQDSIMFVWYFDTIIDCILNNVDCDLKRFRLDIMQEAAIQHFLIYNHNLNFKTWQLTEFVNTKQLHNLLEPNIHNLNNSLIKKRLTS